MNKLEKKIYDILKKHQKLKNFFRNIYQSFFDLLPDKKNFTKNELIIKEGYFFGFHDLCPFSIDGEMVLSNKLDIPLHMPTEKDTLTVGYFKNNMTKYIPIDTTVAWNYHKGCRLQWVGNNMNQIAFNVYHNYKLKSKIYNLDDCSAKIIDYPIDTISPNGNYATSFSYERLNRFMPGYGYVFSDDAYLDEQVSEKTGLYLIDLKKNKCNLIVTLKQLSLIEPDSSMENAYHFVTHTQFSLDGERIAFLHRWTKNDPNNRISRLVTCKVDGTDIHVSCTSGMVSHFDWDEKNGIIAYCQVNGVDGHYIFDDYKMESAKRVIDSINSDGHQSFINNTEFFVTDTYPDKWRHAKVYLCNIKKNQKELILDLKSPKKFQSPSVYKHWACDLHPRISQDGKYVCIDSVHTGIRSLCVMKLEEINEN